MRYLLLIVFVAILGACQNPKIETLESKIRTLEAEKAGLVLLYEKEVKKRTDAIRTAREAQAEAILAKEAAEIAMQEARLRQAELEKCKEGK